MRKLNSIVWVMGKLSDLRRNSLTSGSDNNQKILVIFLCWLQHHRQCISTAAPNGLLDTPMNLTSVPLRAMSVDTTANATATAISGNNTEGNRCSNISDESGPIATPPAISSSSSEHDNHEVNAWSSDYSNSEDEFNHLEDGVSPVRTTSPQLLAFTRF